MLSSVGLSAALRAELAHAMCGEAFIETLLAATALESSILGEPAGLHTYGTPEPDELPATARRDPSGCRGLVQFDEPAPSRIVKDNRYP
jgi:hypothetical protein